MAGSIWSFTGGIPAGAFVMIGAAFVLFVVHLVYAKTMA